MTQALVLERVTEMGGLNPHHSVRGRRISENWAMDYYPQKNPLIYHTVPYYCCISLY
jgi:hypothetical protein